MSNVAFYTDGSVVSVGSQDIESLKARVGDTELKRIRLCAHRDAEDSLHEMFIVLSQETYIRPAKHLNKDESLHVVEGRADVIFYDEMGSITQVIPLGDYASGYQFFYRIREPVYHSLLLRSDTFTFCETTLGPLRKSDTVLAPWSPDGNDLVALRDFMERLKTKVEEFRRGSNVVTSNWGI